MENYYSLLQQSKEQQRRIAATSNFHIAEASRALGGRDDGNSAADNLSEQPGTSGSLGIKRRVGHAYSGPSGQDSNESPGNTSYSDDSQYYAS